MFEKIRNRLDFRGAVLDLLKYDGLDFLTGSHWWGTNGINRTLVSYIHSGEMELTAKGWRFNHDPRRAAIDHIDRVYRAYSHQTKISDVPKDFTIIMGNLTKYRNVEISQFWKNEIQSHAKAVEKFELEQKARLPQIIKARAAASRLLIETVEEIYSGHVEAGAWEIWDATSGSPKTEWEIHEETGLSIEDVCKWILVFATYGLVKTEFSYSHEPSYAHPFFPPSSGEKLLVYDAFMESEDFR